MAVVPRYVVHAVVLLIAVVLSGYATLAGQIPAGGGVRLGIVNAAGLVLGQGGQVGDVTLGRMSTVVKPVAIPTSPFPVHSPFSYTVPEGGTLQAMATKFNLTVADIRWSNPALEDTIVVSPGEKLWLPPVRGVVVRVHQGDTAKSLAAAYHVDVNAVIDFNYLRDPDHLQPGTLLVVPSGQGKQFPDQQASDNSGATWTGGLVVRLAGPVENVVGDHFPYGYCTWYVASRRSVPWTGDAWQWYGEAQAYGWKTGQTPRVGAIMVTWESGWGHVAYVESVHPNGSWTVSEMNYTGWALIDERTIRPGQVPLIGFIY